MSKLALLIQKDVRVLLRDGLMVMLLVLPLLLAALLRAIVPWIPLEGIDLYAAPAAVMAVPAMIGSVLGFVLIEEREQRTWLLLRVLPLSEVRLFAYVGGLAAGMTFVASIGAAVIYGLAPRDPVGFVCMLTVNALAAPPLALAMGVFAPDKIQGMALSKIAGIPNQVPILIFLIPVAWQVLLAWSPYYWIYLGLIQTWTHAPLPPLLAAHWPGLPFWSCVVVPLLLCAAVLPPLLRLYRRRVH